MAHPPGCAFLLVTGMKKIFCFVCIIVLSLCPYSVPESEPTEPEQTANYTLGIYELTFHAKIISNDHVGNDWTITYKHNGKTIKSGYKILLSLDIFMFETIEVKIEEEDKLDDIATGTMKVAICDGGSGKTTITVTENGGPYTGREAVWEITCTVKLVGKQGHRPMGGVLYFSVSILSSKPFSLRNSP